MERFSNSNRSSGQPPGGLRGTPDWRKRGFAVSLSNNLNPGYGCAGQGARLYAEHQPQWVKWSMAPAKSISRCETAWRVAAGLRPSRGPERDGEGGCVRRGPAAAMPEGRRAQGKSQGVVTELTRSGWASPQPRSGVRVDPHFQSHPAARAGWTTRLAVT